MTERRPLTHHEILRLIEPFAGRGRHVDLAASDRIERRLLFKPIVHGDDAEVFEGAIEVLQLEDLRPSVWRLIRTTKLPTGETAQLVTEGSDLGELLDRIESVSLRTHFVGVGDVVLARSYRLDPTARVPGDPFLMALTTAEARLNGLTLSVKTSTARGYPAEIELSPQEEQPHELPDDLLAALGWNWGLLRRRGTGWIGTLRAPGREPDRSRRVETALERGVAHLAQTLAEPPRQFHQKFARARWGVAFRRTIPLLGAVALFAGALAMVFIDVPQDSPLALMMFNAPPILLATLFTLQEMPRLEIPSAPRPSRAPSWFPGRAQNVRPSPEGGESPEGGASPEKGTGPENVRSSQNVAGPQTILPSEV
ncbi:hypothetical protein GJ654_14295 [Rhodoblastus acidophilus]|uniref:Uncharacterized protein n=1 Tax=Rhodoblastus acidophilus TaxID=1074 RepID=A0A6N8DQP0_RHOAC|nr:hypothetical protein [Rhodoblastus acidophilus]MCW2275190.1 hypothetical protein [Rhodoblastus acidophilus]MTV32156.1 hypothetical protein [Rhodoblastus acidophilus]